MMRQALVRFSLAVALAAFPAAAMAQDAFAAAQAQVGARLADIERNIIDKEALEMNYADWDAKAKAFGPRLNDLNRRYDELNAYCQGTYEEEEYNRRLAYCNSMASQLDTMRNQLQPEGNALDDQRAELDARDTRRSEAAQQLFNQLAEDVERMVLACIDLPPAQGSRCRLLSAPGPRTRDMVAQINADLAGDFP